LYTVSVSVIQELINLGEITKHGATYDSKVYGLMLKHRNSMNLFCVRACVCVHVYTYKYKYPHTGVIILLQTEKQIIQSV